MERSITPRPERSDSTEEGAEPSERDAQKPINRFSKLLAGLLRVSSDEVKAKDAEWQSDRLKLDKPDM